MRPQQFASYTQLTEPLLSFHPTDAAKRDQHPLRGLLQFGPFSNAFLESVPAEIRIATIAPAGSTGALHGFVAEMSARHAPVERRAYLPDYPGFEQVFAHRLATPASATVEFDASLEADITGGPDPQRSASAAVAGAFRRLQQVRNEWDVVFIYFPSRWQPAFGGGFGEDFDLHDFVKAIGASNGLPTQVVTDKLLRYTCRASVCWRQGIALYTKAGGVPWKMVPIEPQTAFIGISYALRQSGAQRFVTCCSQIFDEEGAGLEFLLYDTEAAKVTILNNKNPFLNREQMRAVMSWSLTLYLDRHAGRMPRRVVVHKNTEFKGYEIEGAFQALSRVEDVELLTVQETSWRGVRLLAPKRPNEKNQPDPYPVKRGTLLTLSESELLLWTQGDCSVVTGGQPWFPQGKGIPHPLILQRYAGHGDAALVASEILALSKMDWNNDALYDKLPATQSFAERLAEVVKRMPKLEAKPYALRLFM